ncbi:hypothetical protein [Bradyrhizobium sp. UFLA05-112]
MTRFTTQERTKILTEARRRRAAHLADREPKKEAVLQQKRKMMEHRRAREGQQTFTVRDCNALLGFVATLKSAIRVLEGRQK